MAIKVDRPVDFGGDGIVVYVAKSIEEVNKARAGLGEAGVPVELPEAAIEAMWAAGRTSLPIRVTPDVYKAALDVIDELFPPPELVLPGDPEPGDEPEGGAPSGPALDLGPAAERESGPLAGPAVSNVQTEASGPARKQADLGKLKFSLLKLIFIAATSLVLPGLGIALAIFCLWGSFWVWRKLDTVNDGATALTRAKFTMGLSGFALLWGVGLIAYVAWEQGWTG
jgi:hypothetical protein